VSSDGGALLLREVDRRIHLLERLAGCFLDGRSPSLLKHQLSEMLAQRIYGLALGYEDLNDHDELRHDPLLSLLSGKRNVEQELAGKSTPNRLELSGRTARYHKITYSAERMELAAGGSVFRGASSARSGTVAIQNHRFLAEFNVELSHY
jgi:Transposase DDE domain group 1